MLACLQAKSNAITLILVILDEVAEEEEEEGDEGERRGYNR